MKLSFTHTILTLNIILLIVNTIALYLSVSDITSVSANCISYKGDIFCSQLGYDICRYSTASCVISVSFIIINKFLKLGFIFAFLFAVLKLNSNLRNEFAYSIVNDQDSNV